ncbi:hypothetical protein ACFX2I_011885 [Malus domestica]
MTKSKNFLNNLFKTFGFAPIKDGQNEEDFENIAQQGQKHFPFETRRLISVVTPSSDYDFLRHCALPP